MFNENTVFSTNLTHIYIEMVNFVCYNLINLFKVY